MKDKLWFKAKTYGWGWTPVTWQGWAVIVLYIAGLLCNGILVSRNPYSTDALLFVFIPNLILLTVFLFIVCYVKGEEPRWRWPVQRSSKSEVGGEKDTTNIEEKNGGK